MKTLNTILELTRDIMARDVITQLGYAYDKYEEEYKDIDATLKDIANYGINGGFGGFIYYSDTCDFFDNNADAIIARAEDLADELGQNLLDFVNSFRILEGNAYRVSDMVKIVQSKGELEDFKLTQLKDALAKFIAEDIARDYINMLEE